MMVGVMGEERVWWPPRDSVTQNLSLAWKSLLLFTGPLLVLVTLFEIQLAPAAFMFENAFLFRVG